MKTELTPVMLEGPAVTDIRFDGVPIEKIPGVLGCAENLPALIEFAPLPPRRWEKPTWRELLDEAARRRNFAASQGRLLPMHLATATRMTGARRSWLSRLFGRR